MSDSYILIENARITEKGSRFSGVGSVLIKRSGKSSGTIEKIGEIRPTERMKRINARGAYLLPSFVDILCKLREPGLTVRNSVLQSTVSAAAGGYSALIVSDREAIKESGSSLCRLIYASSPEEGGSIVTDASDPICDPIKLSETVRGCAERGSIFVKKCFDHRYRGVIAEGDTARALGLLGIPGSAETVPTATLLLLAREYGCRVHITGVRSKGAVELIREAKAKGTKVTCDCDPLAFSMTDRDVLYYGAYAKVIPPLRSEEDRIAIAEGISNGTVDCISSGHTAVSDANKKTSFEEAEPGAVGFQTVFPSAVTYLTQESDIGFWRISELLAENPARIFGIEGHSLSEGEQADLVLCDPKREIIVTGSMLKSRSHNTPFLGLNLNGITLETFISGEPQFGIGK